MISQKKLTETDVILNFMEDCNMSFIGQPDLKFEFPAGSWTGKKNRNIADIHGSQTPGIEAKSKFADCKKDILNADKNKGIKHYIYSTSANSLKAEEIKFWIDNRLSAAIFSINLDKWYIIRSEKNEFCFSQALREEKVNKIHWK